ncbi:hypothetical protein A2W45_03325 [Candidatus Curtissbacteria bacterium RIFCSPHIGHO2_12_41_11]|uniref:Lipoprotein signal peptidase n=4 Tax=Candidatus Curtissiibacteriota TaxID=1752717 RepID=A0A1F5HUF8_9BACT|nr:MAG: Lipoprotein signal peptidase [Candidatus Curtissbacteria bacterium GW2011_GWC2_38_9]KKS04870.1 MAG: Lipoprotein signal peptidase [Candidatus Curtissbacteria bacterium GW2011_GWA2_41_24]OGE00283.1 MAG: hypothetical protein A2W45_03325 [Candidatus Curtissbacteria bacterium RIFCSPHIGHO2_12_41_11]OGE07808.1 MAG: hypothetical protein A2W70_02840 [Candidatus Curtissbacteria bacterium RIFCSPLOWO2_02_41_11]
MTGDKFIKKLILSSSIILLIIILDQISKEFVQKYLEVSCNFGFAFGLGEASWPILLFVLVLVGYFLFKKKQNFLSFSLSLVIGGGIANLIDRLTVGCVRDFISVGFWPSFNLADAAITFGVLLILFEVLRGYKWLAN